MKGALFSIVKFDRFSNQDGRTVFCWADKQRTPNGIDRFSDSLILHVGKVSDVRSFQRHAQHQIKVITQAGHWYAQAPWAVFMARFLGFAHIDNPLVTHRPYGLVLVIKLSRLPVFVKMSVMTTIVFDSHTFVKRLRATGFTEEQAEVIVDASRDALSQLVTKQDLADMEDRINARAESLELRLTIKLGAFLSIAVGILIAVLRVAH